MDDGCAINVDIFRNRALAPTAESPSGGRSVGCRQYRNNLAGINCRSGGSGQGKSSGCCERTCLGLRYVIGFIGSGYREIVFCFSGKASDVNRYICTSIACNRIAVIANGNCIGQDSVAVVGGVQCQCGLGVMNSSGFGFHHFRLFGVWGCFSASYVSYLIKPHTASCCIEPTIYFDFCSFRKTSPGASRIVSFVITLKSVYVIKKCASISYDAIQIWRYGKCHVTVLFSKLVLVGNTVLVTVVAFGYSTTRRISEGCHSRDKQYE